MDGGETRFRESSHFYSTKFMRHSKAVGVLWGIFTICYAIIVVVVFMQDQWIGDTEQSKAPGNFGLWHWCSDRRDGRDICHGRLDNFSSILSPAFRAATVFCGLAVISAILAILAIILFLMCRSSDVYKICGSLQLLSGIFLSVAILSFPAGWDNPHVRTVCGPEADDFVLGTCGIRWAYMLAVVAFCDSIILGCLALTLATKKLKLNRGDIYGSPSLYKGEINPGFLGDNQSLGGSRKSLNHLQPVMLLPRGTGEGDRYSEFSQRTARSNQSPFRGNHQPQQPNFQL